MIDIHSHVLPNIDDGPKTLEQSINMLRTATKQGITDVINTVHFQHPKFEGKKITFERAKSQMTRLQVDMKKEGINIKLHLGAEVFYLPNLLELAGNRFCTIGKKYMLVEFPFHMLPDGYDKVLFRLVLSGQTPIIAHPERCKPIQMDLEILRRFVRSGCLIQIDGGSILGTLGQSARKTSLRMIEQKLCHFIASDAHDDNSRNFCLEEIYDVCKAVVGEKIDEWVYSNPKKALMGEDIVADVSFSPEPSVTFWQKIGRRFHSHLTR